MTGGKREILVVRDIDGEISARFRDQITAEEASFVIGDLRQAMFSLTDSEIQMAQVAAVRLAQQEKESQTFHHAAYSPLPAIPNIDFDPARDNYDILAETPDWCHWVAVLDFDGTLFRPHSRHTIILHQFARFLFDHHGRFFPEGSRNLKALKQLIEFCDTWESQRKDMGIGMKVIDAIEYEEGIIRSGDLSAAALEGFHLSQIKQWGREFVENGHLGGEFFDYTAEAIDVLKDHGILPVMVTGAPDFLVPFLLKKANMTHGNGMTYEMTADKKFNGTVKTNMGIAKEKARHCGKLTSRGLAIAMAKGDSVGDAGLFGRAIRSSGDNDITGGAILVNGNKATENEIGRHYAVEISEGRFQVVPQGLPSANVIGALHIVLKSIFEPLHEFLKLKGDAEKQGDPEKLRKALSLLESKAAGNIGNIKKMRDILKGLNMEEKRIRSILLEFFPPSVVDPLMNPHMLDTRDLADLVKFVHDNRALVTAMLGLEKAPNSTEGS